MTDDTQGERWRPIPGYNGRYEASDAGRIRSTLGRAGALRLLKAVPDEAGYGRVAVGQTPGCNVTKRVHRLVALTFYGPCPEGLEVRHLDGNNKNNALNNLRYGTRSENVQDMIRHGTHNGTGGEPKTHCPHGHPYSAENTYIYPDGRKACRTCIRATSAARWGSRRPKLDLSDQAVAEIRDRCAAGEQQKALAAEYGLSKQHVSNIVLGRRRRA